MAANGSLFTSFRVVLICFVIIGRNYAIGLDQKVSDEFEEELYVKPLHNGYVYSHFQFTTRWANSDRKLSADAHYRLFPKTLGEILNKYQVGELHLSLTQGLWKHRLWGYPVVDAAPGAELWVWFRDEVAAEQVDATWLGLCNALSGLFCASLNFIDATNTIRPRFSFRPAGLAGQQLERNSTLLRYAALPQEIACTENLTPWKKLLPCSDSAGLATLLNARQAFNAHYVSVAVHVRNVCQKSNDCSSPSLELAQTISLVSDLYRRNWNKPDWSFSKLYGNALYSHCPLASTSAVYVDLSNNNTSNVYTLSPSPSKYLVNGRGVQLALYQIDQWTSKGAGAQLNVAAVYPNPFSYISLPPPPIHLSRFIEGSGRENGRIECVLYNNHPTATVQMVYLEHIPSFARVFSHTLSITSNGKDIVPDHLYLAERQSAQHPFHMELVLSLAPGSITRIGLHFERAFLKWTDYPPDANHGFYIPPAVVSLLAPSARNYTSPAQRQSGLHPELQQTSDFYFLRMHTEILLLVLPTPDFSMPYNVICLVCTIVALAYGPLHNITTKRLTLVDTNKPGAIQRLIQRNRVLRGIRQQFNSASQKLSMLRQKIVQTVYRRAKSEDTGKKKKAA